MLCIGNGRLGGNLDGFARFLGLPAWGKRLDVGDQVDAVLIRQRVPVRHVRVGKATPMES